MSTRYTLSLVFALAIVLASSVSAQERAVSSVSIVEVAMEARGDEVTLRHFDPDAGGAIIGTQAGGYVFGTNGYGDIGKSVAFELPGGMTMAEVVQIDAVMFRSGGEVMSEYDVSIYVGDEIVGPLEVIDGKTFPITHIEHVGTEGPIPVTEHVFDSPIPVVGSFHAAFTWDENHFEDDMGMVSSSALPYHSPYEWEQWDDGIWRELATSWGQATSGWHVWVEAVVQPAVSTEGDGDLQTIRLLPVHPNPVAVRSNVEFELPAPQHVRVEVFNLLGQRVATVFDGLAPATRSVLTLEASEFTSGLYVVRIIGEGFTESRKFIVAH